jgi:hypothetical protein
MIAIVVSSATRDQQDSKRATIDQLVFYSKYCQISVKIVTGSKQCSFGKHQTQQFCFAQISSHTTRKYSTFFIEDILNSR